MWLTDIFKINELKNQIQSLQKANAVLAEKLHSLDGENYFTLQGKVGELSNCYNKRLQESQTLSAQIRERFEKVQELDRQLLSSQRELTYVKEMYQGIAASLNYEQCSLSDKYLEECERTAPTVRLALHDMDEEELRRAYREKEKLITDLFRQYDAVFTKPADKALYELLVLSLKAEIQNILYQIKENPSEDSSSYVKDMCQKQLAIVCEGSPDMAEAFTRFIGGLEYHVMDLTALERRYCKSFSHML